MDTKNMVSVYFATSLILCLYKNRISMGAMYNRNKPRICNISINGIP